MILIFNGPNPRYGAGGKIFNRGTPEEVTDKKLARYLLSTGKFEEKKGVVLRRRKEAANWPIGKFPSKQSAQAYATQVHGISLDMNKSLPEINRTTLRLAEMAAAAAGDELIPEDERGEQTVDDPVADAKAERDLGVEAKPTGEDAKSKKKGGVIIKDKPGAGGEDEGEAV